VGVSGHVAIWTPPWNTNLNHISPERGGGNGGGKTISDYFMGYQRGERTCDRDFWLDVAQWKGLHPSVLCMSTGDSAAC
jgi:hypothetical protein